MLRKLASALFLCWLASDATAATLSGATLPDTYPIDGQTLVLNGIGVRTLTILHIRVYVAGLYLPRPDNNAQRILASSEPKVIVLKFIHSASKERVDRQYRESEQQNCGNGECDPADQADFERLVAAAPAVSPGDTYTYLFTGNGLRMLANGRLIGDFANRDLAYHLLAAFIGTHASAPALRRQLLGLSGG